MTCLLTPCWFPEQDEKYLGWNEIRCELLLSFLDTVDWWYRHELDVDNVVRDGTPRSTGESRLCGLLHVCFLAWDSGGNVVHATSAHGSECWLDANRRTLSTEHLLSRAREFAQTQFKDHAREFARGCLRWVRQFWQAPTPEEQDCLYMRYLQAFETMHEFVRISYYQRQLWEDELTQFLFQQLERVWRRYQELPEPLVLDGPALHKPSDDRFVPQRRLFRDLRS